MNEPKRRGRPPKVKPEPNARVEGASIPEWPDAADRLIAKALGVPVGCAECGQVVGHYDDCGAGMGVMTVKAEIGAMKAEVINTWFASRSQAYAERVWNGQSPDVPRAERLERVKRALDGQGLSMEGVEL
jgi:hypothetical protein